MYTKSSIGAGQAADNTFKAVFHGQTKCLICFHCKPIEEMENPDLCKKCAEKNKPRVKRFSRIRPEDFEFARRLKEIVPLWESGVIRKPTEPSATVAVVFDKKSFTGGWKPAFPSQKSSLRSSEKGIE